jgi:hypothetical protein
VTPKPVDPGEATPEFVHMLFSKGWDSLRIADYLEIPESKVIDLLTVYRHKYPKERFGSR